MSTDTGDTSDQAYEEVNVKSKQQLRTRDCFTQLSARYPFTRESSVEEFLSDESYHRLLCNFLHGSLTKNSGLPNIKYIQKLDNSNFLLSALKCRILCFPDLKQLEFSRPSLSHYSQPRTYIAEKETRTTTDLKQYWNNLESLETYRSYCCFIRVSQVSAQ